MRGLIRVIVRRPEDVDDVLQETNLVLWRKRNEYDAAREFLPWACQVAKLQALAFLKRVRSPYCNALTDEILQQLAAQAVRDAEEHDGRVRILRQCLDKLTADQREIILRRYDDRTSVKSMAQNLGRSADAVSMRLYRIRKALLECIGRADSTVEATS